MCGACSPVRARWLLAIREAAKVNAVDASFREEVRRRGLIGAWARLPYRFDGQTDAVSWGAAVRRGWAACQDAAAGALGHAPDPSRVWLLVEVAGPTERPQLVHVRTAVGRDIVDPFAAFADRGARRVDYAIRGDLVLRGETLLQSGHGLTPAHFLREVAS